MNWSQAGRYICVISRQVQIYIVAMSDFVKSTEIVWLIVATCALPLLSPLLAMFKEAIFARWYATTVFMLKNLKQAIQWVTKECRWYLLFGKSAFAHLMQTYMISNAVPAANILIIGPSTSWMTIHAAAEDAHIVVTIAIVCKQWRGVKLFCQSNRLACSTLYCVLQTLQIRLSAFTELWRSTINAWNNGTSHRQLIHVAKKLYGRLTHLNEPTTQAIVMHSAHVASAVAWLYQRARILSLAVVTNPTIFTVNRCRIRGKKRGVLGRIFLLQFDFLDVLSLIEIESLQYAFRV